VCVGVGRAGSERDQNSKSVACEMLRLRSMAIDVRGSLAVLMENEATSTHSNHGGETRAMVSRFGSTGAGMSATHGSLRLCQSSWCDCRVVVRVASPYPVARPWRP
jgi:hypothetical protein